MNFFYDYEFIEHFVKTGPLFNKRLVHTVEPIQIAIVGEDGSSFSCYYNDFDLKAVWQHEWLRNNVILPIYTSRISGDLRNHIYFNFTWFEEFIMVNGYSREDVAKQLQQYVLTQSDGGDINFWGDFADYDHVCLANTFGTMMDLPESFPMFTLDLEQLFEQVAYDLPLYKQKIINTKLTKYNDRRDLILNHPDYPKNKDEHNALADAMWNKELYNFLQLLKGQTNANL